MTQNRLERNLVRAIDNYNIQVAELARWYKVSAPVITLDTVDSFPIFITDELGRLISRLNTLDRARHSLMRTLGNPTLGDITKLRMNNKLTAQDYNTLLGYIGEWNGNAK